MKRSAGLLSSLFAAALAVGGFATPDTRAAEPVKAKAKAAETGIAWKVSPSNVVIHLDGKRLGEAGELTLTETKPGMHTVLLVKGEDETEIDIKVTKGQVLQFSYEFSE